MYITAELVMEHVQTSEDSKFILHERVERMRQVALKREIDLQVIIEEVHDPHNAAAVLRSCDGFGIMTVNLVYRAQFPQLSSKVAGNVLRWLDIRRFTSARQCVDQLHAEGLAVYATDMQGVPYTECNWAQPAAIAFGNEHSGCSAEMKAAADGITHIPMAGMGRSLNVSVAAALFMAQATAQRAGRPADERTVAARERIFERWLQRETAKITRR